ncbi:MAG: dihydrodipicolinate synthase family protein [Candidatus Korarchaeum sp.]|nr:dihydrodipicolinate synthase family protein [Candidatus Korarchaeum sp.]MDW8035285.1 dihydrodipicolinate synthase family protein [Candidatus Korarchaeum sp.]
MTFRGIITPLVTPFKEDLSLDLEAVRWLAQHQTRGRVHGVFPNSTTGEFVHLNREEAVKLVEVVLEEVGGKLWVLPGISDNSTDRAVELGLRFKDMGVDGIIVTPPFFFKVDRERLKFHFSRIAERLDLPIVIYNIPSTTGINIPIELYRELAQEFGNIVGAKVTLDSVSYLRSLINSVKSLRKEFSVLTGMDYLLLFNLMMRGDGGITALANVAPELHRTVYDAWVEGDLSRALRENEKLMKLSEVYDIASSYPTAVKTALYALRTPVKPYVRPPLTIESREVVDRVAAILRELGFL